MCVCVCVCVCACVCVCVYVCVCMLLPLACPRAHQKGYKSFSLEAHVNSGIT